MREKVAAFVVATALATTNAGAFDARGADIIGLRLGMTAAEATAALGRQGFAVTRDHDALTATTRDGQLDIRLDGEQLARIRYIFRAHEAGAPESIAMSVLNRFGPPQQKKPMAWCLMTEREAACPQDVASLTFFPETPALVLQSARTPRP